MKNNVTTSNLNLVWLFANYLVLIIIVVFISINILVYTVFR